MSKTYILRSATIVNEGKQLEADILIKNGIIQKIGGTITADPSAEVIDLQGKYLLPGYIDDQVHFREQGLTHKANIATESRASVSGG
ncbi:MAG: dihydroorotase, partial [Flavobacteriales bacterium]